MKHIKLFEGYNTQNWGGMDRYGRYTNHPFLGKKVIDLCPNFDFENYGFDKDLLTVQSMDISRNSLNSQEKGYWGDIYLKEEDNWGRQFHFYTDNDESIKILTGIDGDDRGCYCIPGKDTFVSQGHDGPIIFDTVTGEKIRILW